MTEPWGAPRSYGWGQRPGGGGGGARAWLWLGSLASQPLRLPLLLPTWEPSARGASEARPLCRCSGAPASHHGIALCAHAPGTHALMGVFCVPGCLPPHLRTIRLVWDARYSLCLTHSYSSARTHRRRPGERLPFPAGIWPPPGQREYLCAHLLPGHRADPRQAPVEPVAEWLPGPCLTTRDSGPCKSLSWGALGLGAGGGGPRPFHLRPRRGSESGLLATTVRMLMASKAPPWAPLRPPPTGLQWPQAPVLPGTPGTRALPDRRCADRHGHADTCGADTRVHTQGGAHADPSSSGAPGSRGPPRKQLWSDGGRAEGSSDWASVPPARWERWGDAGCAARSHESLASQPGAAVMWPGFSSEQ